jgi:hypothetical protein
MAENCISGPISVADDWVMVWMLEKGSVNLGDEDTGLRKDMDGFAAKEVAGEVVALLNELTMASMVRVRHSSKAKCLKLGGSVLSDR